MTNIPRLWNNRAKLLGDSYRAVMEQSFPPVVNEAIHAIHVREIMQAMPKETRRVLDVGCGWGRIALDIVKRRGVYVRGIDVSSRFVKLFNTKLQKHGKALVGEMRVLPYGNSTFDVVYCVTSLMYLSQPKDQALAVHEMLRVLRRHGRLVLIEPNSIGVEFVRLGGFIPFVYRLLFAKKKVETFGISFHTKDMLRLIRQAGGKTISLRGYPLFTLLLLPLVVLAKARPEISKSIISYILKYDQRSILTEPSYFKTWIIEKKKNES